jgi:uncharacterized protein YndB with AHSA1/START domain
MGKGTRGRDAFGEEGSADLVVRRFIAVGPDRLFRLWTRAESLQRWWGPAGVTCPFAEIDPRSGGAYTIDNLLPDGSVVRITGEFERVDPPTELVFSWRVQAPGAPPPVRQRVTVRFDAVEGGTDVVVRHQRIPDEATRANHEQGWIGCLEGLDRLAGTAPG